MYKQIGDYGLIGDMHSLALVSNQGSIDYCSMPHIDSPTIFAALLDDQKGGFFRIQPEGRFTAEQEYIKDTNILSCTFKTETAQAKLLDFMPMENLELFDKEEHAIHRCLKVISGKMDFYLECLPRPQYASALPSMLRQGNSFEFKTKREILNLILQLEDYDLLSNDNHGCSIRFSLKQGQDAHFDLSYGRGNSSREKICPFPEVHKFWVDWLQNCIAGKCSFLGEYTDLVNRSLLALKLLTFQPTGAIAASATTSLPEVIGGQRNWDYRFSWIRDASFTLKALFNLGHITEAESFIRWLHRTYKKSGSNNLQIMYSLDGQSKLTEKRLQYLKGYKDSRPVRVGNAAYKQNQWDIYGEIMDSALRLSDYAGKIDQELWPFFRDICNLAVQNWRQPDAGIWELRNGPFHFVYSKAMCWVALDRGIKIARRYGFTAPLKKWKMERERIKEDILTQGYDRNLNSFVQRYGAQDLDASLLLLPLMGFLGFGDERVKGTIQACKRHLFQQGFLLRYLSDDGLKGAEGAFILCNFWLIQCLALSGKIDQAKSSLAKTVQAANHLGLFAEEYDFKKGQMLGNFPQAISHIGFINAVWTILSVQYKVSPDPIHTSFLQKIKKRIPLRIVLNQSEKRAADTAKDIASQLKLALNNLQGAFFNVAEGKVNYQAMKKSQSYKAYLALVKELNSFNPFSLRDDAEKKAFWINIYNILIIHGVIELGIEDSVKEVFNFFSRIGYNINGLFFTPDDIEHGILRGNRPHPVSGLRQFLWRDKRKALAAERLDPRIHFALVCASSSCPPIEFYDAANLDAQLDMSGRSFLNRKGIVLEQSSSSLYLSQIFKWYFSDFGKTEKDLLRYVLKFAEPTISNYVLENLDKIKIKYLPYNWNLNKALE